MFGCCLLIGDDDVWVLFALFRWTLGDGDGTLSLEDEARLRFPSSNDPRRSRVMLVSSLDLEDSNLSRSSSPFILSMMYLSGIRPSWPLTDPFHQSLETCFVRETVSPLWKLTSLVDLALKSYNA